MQKAAPVFTQERLFYVFFATDVYGSKCSRPKYCGQWKLGWSNAIGFQDRKCGVCNRSPHL